VLYEPQATDSYKPERTVKVRRFAEILAKTGLVEAELGSAVSLIEPGETLEKHKHPVTEFIYLVNGTAEVWVEGQTQKLAEGDVVVVPADNLHSVSNCGSEPFRVFHFWWGEVGGE
jgi:quercetin dioxygenase-like cupin family protein